MKRAIAKWLAPDVFEDAEKFYQMRSEVSFYNRWLAEFPLIRAATERLLALGQTQSSIHVFRDDLRSFEKKIYIKLNESEIQSGHTRVKWAQYLIKQLPKDDFSRNEWLSVYGDQGWKS